MSASHLSRSSCFGSPLWFTINIVPQSGLSQFIPSHKELAYGRTPDSQ
jgi:hypothetical protein